MKVHEEHKKRAPKNLLIGIIIVSSSRFSEISEGKQNIDKTIPLIKSVLGQHADVSLGLTKIIADSEYQLKQSLDNALKDDTLDCIIFSGGTGLTAKDITYETIVPLFEKELSGFGELFRHSSCCNYERFSKS